MATYSVRAWPSGPSVRLLRGRARPKSQSFTVQLVSRRTLEGCGEEKAEGGSAGGRAGLSLGLGVWWHLLIPVDDTS